MESRRGGLETREQQSRRVTDPSGSSDGYSFETVTEKSSFGVQYVVPSRPPSYWVSPTSTSDFLVTSGIITPDSRQPKNDVRFVIREIYVVGIALAVSEGSKLTTPLTRRRTDLLSEF